MKKDSLENLFENLEGDFDVHQTPTGHQSRFLDKLKIVEKPRTKRRNWMYPVSIAASIAAIFVLGFFFQNTTENTTGLASVSPEMKQTESFFKSTIEEELRTLQSFNTPESEALVKDALVQLEVLEKEYKGLKRDLSESGNDKRVIYAMITNFQNRIDLLQNVISTLEEVKTLKAFQNETTL